MMNRGTAVVGIILAAFGAWLLGHQVVVTHAWTWLGPNTFGVTLSILAAGIIWMLVQPHSNAAKVVTIGALVIITAGILLNLQAYFRPTSLFTTLVMIAALAVGVGLLVRSVQRGELL
jgi:uncharacterized protein